MRTLKLSVGILCLTVGVCAAIRGSLPVKKAEACPKQGPFAGKGDPVAMAFWKGSQYLLMETYEATSLPKPVGPRLLVLAANGRVQCDSKISPDPQFRREFNSARAVDLAVSPRGLLHILLDNGAVYSAPGPQGPWTRSKVTAECPNDWNFSRMWSFPTGDLLCLRGSSSGDLFESPDSGERWWKRAPRASDSSSEDSVVMSEGSPMIVRGVLRRNGADQVLTFYCEDEGRWRTIGEAPLNRLMRGDEAPCDEVMQFLGSSIFLGGSNESGDPGMLYFSEDKGLDWISYQAVPDRSLGESNAQVFKLPMVEDGLLTGARTAVALISNRILVTKNAGKSWKRVWYSKHAWETRLYRAPDGTLWVLGTDILKSKDYGQAWELVLRIRP